MRRQLKWLILFAALPGLTACQLPYLLKSAYDQTKLLNSRVPIEEALANPKLDQGQKNQILLAEKARKFAEQRLRLKSTDNYRSFVQLDGPYVTYIVTAAPVDKLEHHLWSFPIIGKVPYKGYFREQDAKEEAANFDPQRFDTYVRGVTAYSTLGWFDDPLLSSMLNYPPQDLVNVIIHETVHATLYIKGHADFNERLATYIGNQGTELFFRESEGENSSILQAIREELQDDRLFSQFISKEISELKKWYLDRAGKFQAEEKRQRLAEIQSRFLAQIKPLLKGSSYTRFSDQQLNNALLMTYQTYVMNLEDFERAFIKLNRDFAGLLDFARGLSHSKNPEEDLKKFIADVKL